METDFRIIYQPYANSPFKYVRRKYVLSYNNIQTSIRNPLLIDSISDLIRVKLLFHSKENARIRESKLDGDIVLFRSEKDHYDFYKSNIENE